MQFTMRPGEIKEFFRYAIVPISFFVIMLLVIPVSRLLNLPSENELISITKSFYLHYGYWVVFIAAVAEGLLFINWYLPGSVVIVLGVVFAKDASLNVILVVAFITLGFLLAATSAGILKLSFIKFFLYSFAALVMWNTLWSVATYFSGMVIIKTLSPWTVVIGLAIWIMYLAIRFKQGKSKPTEVVP